LIQITRLLARQLRAVIRNSILADPHRGTPLAIAFCADQHGLTVRAQGPEVGLEYHQPGELSPETVRISVAALDDFAGLKATPVILESTAPNTVQARWDDGGVPQLKDYSMKDDQPLPEFPATGEWTTQEPRLLNALAEAAKTTAKDGTRYALMKVQLRGARGQVVATDGRQLLVEAGFAFPWQDDTIVPALPALGSKPLSDATDIAIARAPTQIGIRVGAWTFWLQIDQQARFPRTDDVIPARESRKTFCRLTASEAAFLARTLPRMHGLDDPDDPVTIDLNGHLAVRTKGEGQNHITELVLPQSSITGPFVRLRTNRCYLNRALALGLPELQLVDASTPIVCQDEKRTYVWMPLDKKGALEPADDAVRISPPEQAAELPSPTRERNKQRMAKPTANGTTNIPPSNGSGNGHTTAASNGTGTSQPVASEQKAPSTGGLAVLIEEAKVLKDAVRDCCKRANRLVAALKRYRRQSKLLAGTVAALRQLQTIDS
jgi:hypothetical protein